MVVVTAGLTDGLVGGVQGGSSGISRANLFQMDIKTDNTGTSTDVQFTLPLDGSSTYNFDIDWGDGNSETITTNTPFTHTYSSAGTYRVAIGGTNKTLPHLEFDGDKDKLIAIKSWGHIVWESFDSTFFGCDSLVYVTTDPIDASQVTSMFNCWRNVDNLPVLNMSAWDNMPLCVQWGSAFRQLLSPDIILTGMDTSAATTFSGTFRQITTTTLDVSSLDTSSCTNFQNCFNDTDTSVDVSMWDWSLVNNAVSMMLNSAFAQPEYDKLLAALQTQDLQSTVTFSAGTAKFGAGEPATSRTKLVDVKSWTITDGGAA